MKKLLLFGLLLALSSTLKAQWQEANNGLYGGEINCIAISGNNIFAGTYGSGIFRAKLSDLVISSVEVEQVGDLHIFPNPASDYLEISGIKLTANQFEDIQIFNTLGKCAQALKLKTDLQENERIDISGLPAGVYILKLNNKVQRFVKY
jgi:hypothetical protein